MKFDLELYVGLFLLAGILCLGYLSVKLARLELIGTEEYEIYAVFDDIGGLKKGASVMIAGVVVGKVTSVVMEDYEARLTLSLPTKVKIQEDAIASIKTKGMIGEKYISIMPGGSDLFIKPGERLVETQASIDVEELISSYVFGKI
jgi:phospholipid/cholesterol/gamma-HCH transport system substrate-binding protein